MSGIEARVQAFTREARLRRAVELAAAVLIAGAFAEYASWFENEELSQIAASVVGTVLGVTVALMLLTRSSPPKGGTDAELAAAWKVILRRQARAYAWAPLWMVLPILISVCAFVISLDHAVYGSSWPSAMLPADIGIMVAVGLGVAVLTLEWSRRLAAAAATLTAPPVTPAAPAEPVVAAQAPAEA